MTSPAAGPTPYHHGALRETLIDVAIRLIADKGVDGWSLREAARTIGVSPGAAYHHFRDRAALVAAVAARGFAALGQQMHAELAAVPTQSNDDPTNRQPGSSQSNDGDPGARLAALARGYLGFALANPELFRVAFGPMAPHTGDPSDPGVYDILQDELDRLAAARVIDPAARQHADFIVWSAVHGLANLLIDGQLDLGPTADPLHAAELTARTVLIGLSNNGSSRAANEVHQQP